MDTPILTFSQGLEDKFDGNNRRNLRHAIVRREDTKSPLSTPSEKHDGIEYVAELHRKSSREDEQSKPPPTYYVLEDSDFQLGSEPDAILKALTRIPTCAIFHKLTTGPGVPHTFISECGAYISQGMLHSHPWRHAQAS